MLEKNKVIMGDCLVEMQKIPDKSIDMILCDLPYGTTRNKWDEVIPLWRLWDCYSRIIKDNGAIVLTAQTPFDKVLGASNLKLLRYEWIWKKDQASNFLNARHNPMKIHENILVFYKKTPIYNPQMRKGFNSYSSARSSNQNDTYMKNFDTSYVSKSNGDRYPISVLEFIKERGLHPTQKPVALFEYLIKTYTNEGDTVLDNCAGSFTTAIAAENTKRNWICIEQLEEYCEIGKKRIEENRKKLST